jgi:integrase
LAKLALHYVQSIGAYHYFSKRGQPRIALPGIVGSTEFMEAYQAALASDPAAIGASTRSRPGTVAAGLAAYFSSSEFRSLASGTSSRRRAVLERFRECYGERSLVVLPKDFLVELLDRMTRHSARQTLKAFKHFFIWAAQRKLVRSDPTLGLRVKAPKSNGHATWIDSEIEQYRAAHPVGTMARLALEIGAGTALRREDAVGLDRQHLRNGEITIRPAKTRNTTGIEVVIPVQQELQEVLDIVPADRLTWIVNERGASYTPDAFGNQFRRWCSEAKLPKHCKFHGLRKYMLTRLANAGCSTHRLMCISGHTTLKEVARYTEKIDRARGARAAMATLREQTAADGVKSKPAAV